VPGVFNGPIVVATLAGGSDPVHESEPLPPLAVQEVALTVDQESVVDSPA
jgi:hypothetical protein